MTFDSFCDKIKLNQIKQGISVKKLAERTGVTPQVITDIRGYRLKVSEKMLDAILKELGITDISNTEKESLLSNQHRAKENKHRKYLREKQKNK